MNHRPGAAALAISAHREEPTGEWSKADHDTAVRMRLEGKGATEISEVVGRTRAAVIGHLWRHGVKGQLKGGGGPGWGRG